MSAIAPVLIDASALASLVQIGAQLVQEIEAIRAANPDAWQAITNDYSEAIAAWNAASAPLIRAAAELPVTTNAAGHYNDARASKAAPVAPAPASGLSTVPAVTVSLSEGVQQAPPA